MNVDKAAMSIYSARARLDYPFYCGSSVSTGDKVVSSAGLQGVFIDPDTGLSETADS